MDEKLESHKTWLEKFADENLASIEKEMEMVDKEVEKMRNQPSRCPICDYERMVKTRHYLWETIHEIMMVKNMMK